MSRLYWTDHISKSKKNSYHDILYINAVPDELSQLKEIVRDTNPRSITTTVDHRNGWFENLFAVRTIERELKHCLSKNQNVSIKVIRGEATASRLAPGRSFEIGAATYHVVASTLSSPEESWPFLSRLAQRTRRDGIVLLNILNPNERKDDHIFESAGFEVLERKDTRVTLRAPWRDESTQPGQTYMLTQESMISILSSCPNRDKTDIGAPVASSSIKDRLVQEEQSMETEIKVPRSSTNETTLLSSFRDDVLNRAQQYADIKTSEYDPLNDILDNTTRLCVELERISGIESASCASLAISFISMALHRPVRSDVAICANLELDPENTGYEASELVYLEPVSNIESRLRSARCASIPTIVLASSQRESVEKLPADAREGLYIEYCDTLEELFDLSFCEDPYFTL